MLTLKRFFSFLAKMGSEGNLRKRQHKKTTNRRVK